MLMVIKREVTSTMEQQREQDAKRFVSHHTWRTPIKHKLRAYLYQARDIKIPEATAAKIALEWSTESCPSNPLVVMTSDSTTSICAFAKGRSSKPPMMTWCRRQAVLKHATCLTDVLIHVRSALNPADDVTWEP